MKILLVNKYHYLRGGSETYYFGLAKLLEAAGHEVIFFAMADENNRPCKQEKYFVENVDFNRDLGFAKKISAGVKMVYSFEAKRKISRLIKDEKPDIVHINLFHRVLTASVIDAAKKHGIPIVFTMHDLNCVCPNHTMLDHGKICEACLRGKYSECVKRVCFKDSRLKCLMAAVESKYNAITGLYNKIDLFITPSEFYKKILSESGLSDSPVVTMRNFLLNERPYENQMHDGYYLYFGRLSKEKGVMTLLKAVLLLKGKVKLHIAGAGDQEEELKAFVNEQGMNDRVLFTGFLSGEELQREVGGAKCIILPSEWYENGPYAVMEAMAAGKPVIVSDLGGLPEIVKNGETGFIFNAFSAESLAESILKTENLSDCELKRMGGACKSGADVMFDKNKYISALLAEYENLTARFGGE